MSKAIIVILVIVILGLAYELSNFSSLKTIDDQNLASEQTIRNDCGDALGATADTNLVELDKAVANLQVDTAKGKALEDQRKAQLHKIGY